MPSCRPLKRGLCDRTSARFPPGGQARVEGSAFYPNWRSVSAINPQILRRRTRPICKSRCRKTCAVFLRMALPFREQSNRLSRGLRAGLTAWLPQLGRFITEGDALPTVEISTVAIKSLTAFPREESDLARAVHTTTASSAHWYAVLAKRGRSLLSTLPSAVSGPCNCWVL